jgi:6-pyruvoyltetrahydropterin/6-carboxytetrahydropterin synthase
MYGISKEFSFSAAHYLKGLPKDHPCSRIHGHNYTVKVEIMTPEVDDVGFVIDYHDLDIFKTWIDETLDHRNLNDILFEVGINPTAENLARYMWERIQSSKIGTTLEEKFEGFGLIVYVSETPKTWAWFDGMNV